MCGQVRFRLLATPLVIQVCHCTTCRRATGSAFAVQWLIEPEALHLDGPEPTRWQLGPGRVAHGCGVCHTTVFDTFGNRAGQLCHLRAGTLDPPVAGTPAVHRYTRSRVPWLALSPDIPSFDADYPLPQIWSPSALERMRRHMAPGIV